MPDDFFSEAVITHVGVIGLIYAAAIAVLILLVGHDEPRRLAAALRQPLHILGSGLQRIAARVTQLVARLLGKRRPR
ncbi:MAG: hypothetical protein ACOZDY_11690 [Pseudomonadota bacterium]